MQESQVQSLGQEDPLEEDMATHSSSLAWRIPWTEEPGGLQSKGSQSVGHDQVTSTHFLASQITLSITISWFSKSLLLSCHMVHVLSRYVFPFMFIPLKFIPSLHVITSKNMPVQWCISLPSLRTTSAVPGIPEFYFFLKYPLTYPIEQENTKLPIYSKPPLLTNDLYYSV